MLKFFKDILTEKTSAGFEKYSFTRFSALLLITFYIIVATYKLIKTGNLIDIPTNLSILIAGLYGVNKLSTSIMSSKSITSSNSNSGYKSNNNIDKDNFYFTPKAYWYLHYFKRRANFQCFPARLLISNILS